MIEALRRWLGRPRQPVIRSRQLLDWLEEASQGFLVLDRANRLQHLNGRARRLLGIGTEQVVRGRYLLEVVRCHQLEESVRTAIEMLQPVGAIEHQKPLGGLLQPVEQLPRTDHRLAWPAQPATQRLNHPKR